MTRSATRKCDFHSPKARGFTLVEIAIGMVITGLVLTAILAAYKPYILEKRIKDMNDKFNEVRSALSEHVFFNERRFPCPAPPLLPMTDPLFGLEQRSAATGLCTATNGVVMLAAGSAQNPSAQDIFVGVVPNRTLGIAADHTIDPYGSRLLYAVSNDPSISGNNAGAITVLNEAGVAQITTAPFVLLSHGPDRAGSLTSDGIAYSTGCSAIAGDSENCNGDAIFSDRLQDRDTADGTYYDDVLESTILRPGLFPTGGGILPVNTDNNLGTDWTVIFFEGTYAVVDSAAAGGFVWRLSDGTPWLALTSATGGTVTGPITTVEQCSFAGTPSAEFCGRIDAAGDLYIRTGTNISVSFMIMH